MGLIPPPLPMRFEEFKKAGYRDRKLDRWLRYESNPFGLILLLIDKILKRECPSAFKGVK